MNICKIKIDNNSANQRLDRFVRKYYKTNKNIPLSLLYNRIRKWIIRINWHKKPENYKLNIGDIITLPEIKTIEKKTLTKKITLTKIKELINYEDKNWLVRDKPAWLSIHHSNNEKNIFVMQDYLDQYCQKYCEQTNTFKPSFCFRLDKNTSWILISAKNYQALQWLNEIIRNREVEKYYLAIVLWNTKNKFSSNAPLKKIVDKKFWRWKMIIDNSWKESFSEFEKIKTITDKKLWTITLLKIKIKTWRMHQIRVHLSNLWFPIIGDIIYWNPSLNRIFFKEYKIKRHLLHCHNYKFQRNWKTYNFVSYPKENIWKKFDL